MAWNVYHSNWYISVAILWTAIFTDLLDGYLARKKNLTSATGGLIDHGSDAFFVAFTIAALTHHEWAPVMLVCIIPAAFVQYMLDSKALAGQPLKASSLGKYNGISYFIFAGFPVMQLALGITLIPFDWFVWIGWGLVVTSGISMVDRIITLLSNKQPISESNGPVDE
jgi:phosphatidylglycerophosphate synthase